MEVMAGSVSPSPARGVDMARKGLERSFAAAPAGEGQPVPKQTSPQVQSAAPLAAAAPLTKAAPLAVAAPLAAKPAAKPQFTYTPLPLPPVNDAYLYASQKKSTRAVPSSLTPWVRQNALQRRRRPNASSASPYSRPDSSPQPSPQPSPQQRAPAPSQSPYSRSLEQAVPASPYSQPESPAPSQTPSPTLTATRREVAPSVRQRTPPPMNAPHARPAMAPYSPPPRMVPDTPNANQARRESRLPEDREEDALAPHSPPPRMAEPLSFAERLSLESVVEELAVQEEEEERRAEQEEERVQGEEEARLVTAEVAEEEALVEAAMSSVETSRHGAGGDAHKPLLVQEEGDSEGDEGELSTGGEWAGHAAAVGAVAAPAPPAVVKYAYAPLPQPERPVVALRGGVRSGRVGEKHGFLVGKASKRAKPFVCGAVEESANDFFAKR